MRGALGGMSTGCYAICWQIELQLKLKKKTKKEKEKKNVGCLGGSVVEHLPLAQVVIPGSWD